MSLDNRVDGFRNRTAGRYAIGGVSDKIEAARVADEAAEQSKMAMFSSRPDLFGGGGDAAADEAPVKQRDLALGKRYNIGQAMSVAQFQALYVEMVQGLPMTAPSTSGQLWNNSGEVDFT